MTTKPDKIVIGDSTYDCSAVDPIHMPTIERLLTGTTAVDDEIDGLAIPSRPRWLALTVRILRWYRRTISPRLGSRCVFVPSCSRYAELAFRNEGFAVGMVMTCKRLLRCRAGAGGTDNVGDKTGGSRWNTESNR
jgi:uncharacterized protein